MRLPIKGGTNMKYLTKKLFLISTFMGISLASVFSLATTAYASSFYISPNGNDNNPGTISSPF